MIIKKKKVVWGDSADILTLQSPKVNIFTILWFHVSHHIILTNNKTIKLNIPAKKKPLPLV